MTYVFNLHVVYVVTNAQFYLGHLLLAAILRTHTTPCIIVSVLDCRNIVHFWYV